MRRPAWIIAALLCLALWTWAQREAPAPVGGAQGAGATQAARGAAAAWLPVEARDTLALIERGGPYPHRQDGSVFHNRERRLPLRADGWYREYTVPTPGARDRGARRIVAGGRPPSEFFYSDDHYRSFRRFERGAAP